MNAFLAGLWDGVNLWIQWDAVAPERGYEVQVRYDVEGWKEWRSVFGPEPYLRCWAVLPTFAEGSRAEARIRVVGEEEWVQAREVVFQKCRCLFEIASTRRVLHLLDGTHFTATVDGAVATYILPEEIEIPAGGAVQVEMVACQSTGYCQLDHQDHFLLRPSLGVTIRNLAPSIEDIAETGRDFTVLARCVADGPFTIAFGANLLHS